MHAWIHVKFFLNCLVFVVFCFIFPFLFFFARDFFSFSVPWWNYLYTFGADAYLIDTKVGVMKTWTMNWKSLWSVHRKAKDWRSPRYNRLYSKIYHSSFLSKSYHFQGKVEKTRIFFSLRPTSLLIQLDYSVTRCFLIDQGGWELDESTMEEAASRESLEEAGVLGNIEVINTQFLRTGSYIYGLSTFKWCDFYMMHMAVWIGKMELHEQTPWHMLWRSHVPVISEGATWSMAGEECTPETMGMLLPADQWFFFFLAQ